MDLQLLIFICFMYCKISLNEKKLSIFFHRKREWTCTNFILKYTIFVMH